MRSVLFSTPSVSRGSNGYLQAYVAGHSYEGRDRDELILVVSRAGDQAAQQLAEVQNTEAGSIPYISGPLEESRQPSDTLRRVERKLQRNLSRYDEFLGMLLKQ